VPNPPQAKQPNPATSFVCTHADEECDKVPDRRRIDLPSYFSQEIIAKNARIAAQGPLKPSSFAISLSACSLPCALLALDEMP